MRMYFILLLLKQVNAVVVVAISMIHMQKICVSDAVKDLNMTVFNRMSRINEKRHIKCHETCKCECRLDASIYNNKQHWNDDKCWCEFKGLINKGVCDEGYAWNPSNCECECDESCDVGEYLDYENCKCRKRLVDKLAEEWTENIHEEKLTGIALLEHGNEAYVLTQFVWPSV